MTQIFVRAVTVAIVLAACSLPAVAQSNASSEGRTPALLQLADSGSVGGKVGGTRKKPVEVAPAAPKAVPKAKVAAPSGPSVAGRWRWAAQCSKSGNWTGSITLTGGAGQFSGSMTQDQPGDGGTVLAGSLKGSAVSFKRRFKSRFFGEKIQTWSGTLSGGSIAGQIAYFAEGCSFSMRR